MIKSGISLSSPPRVEEEEISVKESRSLDRYQRFTLLHTSPPLSAKRDNTHISCVTTSNGIDIETKTKRSFETSFFSIWKRNKPARSENCTIKDKRTMYIKFFLVSQQKRRELVLNLSRSKTNQQMYFKIFRIEEKMNRTIPSFSGSNGNNGHSSKSFRIEDKTNWTVPNLLESKV